MKECAGPGGKDKYKKFFSHPLHFTQLPASHTRRRILTVNTNQSMSISEIGILNMEMDGFLLSFR